MITVNEEQLVLIPTVDGVKRTKVVGVTEKVVALADDTGGMILVDRTPASGKITVGQEYVFTVTGAGSLHSEPKASAPTRATRQGCNIKKEFC